MQEVMLNNVRKHVTSRGNIWRACGHVKSWGQARNMSL